MSIIIMIFLILFTFLGFFCLAIHMALQPANRLFPESKLDKMAFHNAKPPSFPSQELKIVTYNIGYAFGLYNNQGSLLSKKEILQNLEEIAHTLKQTDADIIFLQEVDFDAHRTHSINQLEWLQSKLIIPYVASTTTWNKKYIPWPFWPPKNHFGKLISGQAVLSRFPLSKQSIHRFKKPSNNSFWYNWFYIDRIVQEIVVTINNQNYLLYHAHLEAFDKPTREKQIEWLSSSVIKNADKTLFIAGDFNTDNLSHFSQATTFNPSLDNTSFTFPSSQAVKKLDYIFYTPQLLRKNAHTIKSIGSDHLPVMASFSLKKAP